jgi:hypothetical protein
VPARERLLRLATVLVGLLLAGASVSAQSLSASKADAPAPDDLAPAIKALMAGAAARVQSGSATLEFWWVKTLEASGSGEGWALVKEGAIVGAVRVSEPYPDIRGRRIKPGVYTLRYALQPMNGDHLGVSPHREFLLVSPAAADTSPAPAGYQGTVDLSKQTTGIAHPAAWSLDPPSGAKEEVLASYANDAGHQGVVFEVQTSSGPLRFGLILIGKIEA